MFLYIERKKSFFIYCVIYDKTIIHLGVDESVNICHAALRLGKYPPLVTSALVNNR